MPWPLAMSSMNSCTRSWISRRPTEICAGVGLPRASRLTNDRVDRLGHVLNRLMLPEPHYSPARRNQHPVSTNVSGSSPLDLRSPEVPVSSWPCRVFGTSVPKATVDEDGKHQPRKNEIRFAPQAVNGSAMLPEPKAPPVESRTEGQLELSVPSTVSLH